MADFPNKTDVEIDQWIRNFEKRCKTEAALYLELLEGPPRWKAARP
ncbi:hypothetical protein [Rhizobium laguerreae]|nr:hypothetical protein [Rhizobium laguerreae]